MAVISTRHDFATEITIDGWFVTEFDCHVIFAADSECVDSYWVEHVYVHAMRWSHDTVPPRRDELEREITQADPLYRWVSAELASKSGRRRSDEAWGSFLDQIHSEAA